MVQKYRFGNERCIKQINVIREWQEEWQKKVMSEICLLNTWKLDWEINLFDFYVESIATTTVCKLNIVITVNSENV